MNILKSFMWTVEWRIIWRKVIAVVYATYAVAKRKPCTVLSFCNCISCGYNFDDLPSNNSKIFVNAMISCNVLSCCSSKWSYVNYGELHCDLASQDCSLSNDKLQLVFLRLCDVMQPKWSSFCDKFRRRNILQGELSDILEHLYCTLLCSLVSVMTTLPTAL